MKRLIRSTRLKTKFLSESSGMRILISFGHPVWVHFFRHAIRQWESEGAEVLVAARDKDCVIELLEAFDIPHEILSRAGRRGMLRLGAEYLFRTARMCRLIKKFQPDVVVTPQDPCAAQAGWLYRKPVVVFADGNMLSLEVRMSHPFASVICRAKNQGGRTTPKTREYDSQPCLAYLGPNVFRPDPEFYNKSGFSPNERLIVVRLVAFSANHDHGMGGIPNVAKVLDTLKPLGRIIISHERPLSTELQHLSNPLPPHLYHQLLYHADLLVAEGGNAMEAGFLGTPNVLLCSYRAYQWEELAKRELVYLATDETDLIHTAKRFLKDPDTKSRWRCRARAAALGFEDMTDFILNVVGETARMNKIPVAPHAKRW